MEQSYINPAIFVMPTKQKGLGVFTGTAVRKGDVIGIAAGGRIVPAHKIPNLHATIGDFTHQIHEDFHWAPVDELEIDTLDRMNHSCEPNVGIIGDMTFVALRDTEKDEELCWDYAMSEFGEYEFPCLCETSLCRGKLTGNDWRRLDVRLRYYPDYFTTVLRRKIAEDLRTWNRDIVNGVLWAVDECDEGVKNLLEIQEVLLEQQTARHRVEIAIYRNFDIGLRMDGSQQCCRKNSALYRQAFVHPVMIFERRPFMCVGLYGAGDFELLCELIPYRNIARIKVVDWDPEFMEIAKAHLSAIHQNAWQDPRVKIETEFPDAFAYMEKGREKFHYLYVDLTDNSVAETLQPGVGRKLKLRLIPNGKVVIQAGELSASPGALRNLLEGLYHVRASFRYFWVYARHIPFFRYEQVWIIATDDPTFNPMYPSTYAIDEAILRQFGTPLEAYSGREHHAMFSTPRPIARDIYRLLGNRFPQYHLL